MGMKAILIAAHGWHAGWLGPYGNEWVQTPALDRLAAEGVVFDSHVADEPTAAGFRRALAAGRYAGAADAAACARPSPGSCRTWPNRRRVSTGRSCRKPAATCRTPKP